MRCSLLLFLAACGSTTTPPAPPPKVTAPAAAKPAPLSGIWLGTLKAGGTNLRLQLHLDLAASPPGCAVDSLDQGGAGIPCTNVVATASELSFEIPAVHGSYRATVTDANTLTGTFTQGAELPLVLTRQAKALEPVKVKLDPAMPPVDVEKLQAVLDEDLEHAIETQLGPGVGVTIGVVEHGVKKVFSYGGVKPDSVFEIGSITKTFTGLALAQLVEQKKVKLEEPVRALLPKGTVAQPAGPEITLVDLSAQHSGLPRLPGNFAPKDPANPYADYDAKALYAFAADHGVALPEKPVFGYSNLGVGLLGQALAVRAGMSYEALIQKEIFAPLGMKESAIALSPALAKRFVAGHAAKNAPQGAWDLNALAGAGAIRSTAGDMLIYLDAQLHPDHVSGKTAEARTLGAAITASHEVHGEVSPGMHIALNWFHIDKTGSFWHNGATGGFSSFAVFDPARDFGVIVLFNRSIEDGSFADDLGKHIAQRLAGVPAESL